MAFVSLDISNLSSFAEHSYSFVQAKFLNYFLTKIAGVVQNYVFVEMLNH